MPNRNLLRLAPVIAVTLLLPTAGSGQARTFTLDADFDGGTLAGVRHTPVANQLVLGRTAVSDTRSVWVTNTAPGGGSGATPLSPGWVLRLDSAVGPGLGEQVGRYDAVLLSADGSPTGAPTSGNNPGRLAVDANGDAWVVNRAYYDGAKQGSVTRIAGSYSHCVDRNNNGVIDTSVDANGDGIIDPYLSPGLGTPLSQVEVLGQADECVLSTIKIGVPGDIPRAVAVDRSGKIWVASHTGHTLYRFNPNPPMALEAVRVFTPTGSPAFPITAWFYSAAAADDWLYLTSNPGWANVSGTGHVVRVNINDVNQAESVLCGGGAGTCGSVYGIVGIPGTHKAWAGAYSGTGIYKVDFDAVPPTCTCVSLPSQVTGVTLDLNGKVWAAGYSTGNVYRLNPNTSAIEATCPTGGANPHGLSVDFDGYVWSVQDGGPNQLVRFDPVATANNCGRTNYPIDRGTLPIPPGQSAYSYSPYVYSDFTGVQLDRQAPYAYAGRWEGHHDGGVPGVPWPAVTWNEEPQGAVPGLTSLVVSARAADTLAALGVASYQPMTNGSSFAGLSGRYVDVRVDFFGPGWLTPALSDLTIHGPCSTPGAACCLSAGDCDDGDPCTADACPGPGLACTHQAVAACCNAGPDCDDGDLCTTDACSGPGGSCSHQAVGGCCNADGDCGDGDACTTDACSGPGGSCSHGVIGGCCKIDGDCDDGDPCTADACSGPGGTCEHTPNGRCGGGTAEPPSGCGCTSSGSLELPLLLAAATALLRRRRPDRLGGLA